MKKVYKFATGETIPEGAVYLSTIKQTEIETENTDRTIPCFCHNDPKCYMAPNFGYKKCWLVWHYFLVEVKE